MSCVRLLCFRLRQVCDCSFLYWHRVLFPIYLQDVFDSAAETSRLHVSFRNYCESSRHVFVTLRMLCPAPWRLRRVLAVHVRCTARHRAQDALHAPHGETRRPAQVLWRWNFRTVQAGNELWHVRIEVIYNAHSHGSVWDAISFTVRITFVNYFSMKYTTSKIDNSSIKNIVRHTKQRHCSTEMPHCIEIRNQWGRQRSKRRQL